MDCLCSSGKQKSFESTIPATVTLKFCCKRPARKLLIEFSFDSSGVIAHVPPNPQLWTEP